MRRPGLQGRVGAHRIKHQANVYVEGDTHTRTIEGFWSLVKRGIDGTHHSVSAKHLQEYLNEYVWRYINRDLDGPAQFGLLFEQAGEHTSVIALRPPDRPAR